MGWWMRRGRETESRRDLGSNSSSRRGLGLRLGDWGETGPTQSGARPSATTAHRRRHSPLRSYNYPHLDIVAAKIPAIYGQPLPQAECMFQITNLISTGLLFNR